MTVKTLTADQKETLVRQYNNETRSIKWLAKTWGVSTTTVGRVLKEKAVTTAGASQKDFMGKVRVLLQRYNVGSPKALEAILKDHASGQGSLFENKKTA